MADYDYTYNDDDDHDTSRMSVNLDNALAQAEREAMRLRQVTVRPAHLLIGLLQQRDAKSSEAYAVLEDLDVSVPALITALGGSRRPATTRSESVRHLQLATSANNAMGLAFSEADSRRSTKVGTEFMLLGLIREGSGEVGNILAEFGVDAAKVRRQIDARLQARALSADGATKVGVTLAGPTKFASTPKLDAFSRDISAAARAGKLDPFVGEVDKMRQIMDILAKRTKNNPVLIGEPGVGKTAHVEGLAQYMLSNPNEIPPNLRNKRIVSLDLGAMIAGSRYRGDFEERLKGAIGDAVAAKDVILFIDEFHTVIGAGAAEGAMDASNILKPLLARGELQVVAATTLEEHRKYIEKDAALERRFRPVYVEEPSVEQTVIILQGMRLTNEKWHNVTITDDALVTAARLSDRYITTRRQPDKSLDLIDEASARAVNQLYEVPAALRAMEAQIDKLAAQRAATADRDAREALRGTETKLRARYLVARDEWDAKAKQADVVIGPEEIAQVVGAWTGVPVNKLTESESSKLMHMEDDLHKRVIGQDPAVEALSKAVRRARSGVKDPNRPAGTFVFLGPTGVGKTELAKALAEFLFDTEKSLIRLDMSEYQEKHTVSRLVGSPPGYIGHDEGGQLTEPVRQRPFSVVLLDEVEKAHPDVWDTLLQVMDDGRLTDTKGRVANFKDTILILTSNLGVRRQGSGPSRVTPTGWAATASAGKSATLAKLGQAANQISAEPYDQMKKRVMDKVKETFKPEWLNRVDDVIVFGHLSRDELREVVDLKVTLLDKRMFKDKEVHIEVSPKAREELARIGYDPAMGARPLNRAMTKEVEDRIAEFLLSGKVKAGGTVKVDFGTVLVAGKRVKQFQVQTAEKELVGRATSAPERAVA